MLSQNRHFSLTAVDFLSVCLTEHHFTGYNTYGNPFVFGAFLAGQLTNLHVVLSVAVPGLQNPMNFAEGCNLLDMLTKGRCVIGVGTGGSPRSTRASGATRVSAAT